MSDTPSHLHHQRAMEHLHKATAHFHRAALAAQESVQSHLDAHPVIHTAPHEEVIPDADSPAL